METFASVLIIPLRQAPGRDLGVPGHGNDTTLGAERPHLKEWRERG
jgi:hypothetical protein